MLINLSIILLTDSQIYLLPPTGSTGLVVHLHGLTGSAKHQLWKHTCASTVIYLMSQDSARVRIALMLTYINWISILLQ